MLASGSREKRPVAVVVLIRPYTFSVGPLFAAYSNAAPPDLPLLSINLAL
jgi:hypothetical protein